MAIPKYVTSAKDLVTPRASTRKGFLWQALRKTEEALPYVKQADGFLSKMGEVPNPRALVGKTDVWDELVAAAGFSDKSTAYFNEAQLKDALLHVLDDIEKTAGDDWRQEIAYRFLLTRGDTLGGIMRNILGNEAKKQFSDMIISELNTQGVGPVITYAKSQTQKVETVAWDKRVLLFDKKLKLVGKNIDAVLLARPQEKVPLNELLTERERYLVCGELKGGIDPAGADEHWKTARSALERIQQKFKGKSPKLFFAAAAIEPAMATEIWQRLKDGSLDYAANLNAPDQMADLVAWLLSQ